jgi:uncharacterized protein (DUF1810 family)
MIAMDDPFNLQRFVDAQQPVFEQVRAELAAGRKRSHWIWFVFPQIQGLGYSDTSRRFAIALRQEAEAFLCHPILGPRLEDCTRLVNRVEGRSASQIFGDVDAMKFRSSMTLFAHVSGETSVFSKALQTYFAGEADDATLASLRPAQSATSSTIPS